VGEADFNEGRMEAETVIIPQTSEPREDEQSTEPRRGRRRRRGGRGRGRGQGTAAENGQAAPLPKLLADEPAYERAALPPPPPVVRTGSTDRHLIEDEPVSPEPVRRPRTYRDLDFIPDDLD
jgi:hypothetical protein